MRRVHERRLAVTELQSSIERRRGALETARKLACLLGEVITVEAVEPDVAVAVLCEKRFPRLPCGRQRVGCEPLRHTPFRPLVLPIAVEQHVLLGTLHVDLEEIERGRRMLPAQILEGCDGDDNGLRGLSELRLRRAGMAFDHGREAVEVVHEIKGGLTYRRADERLDVAIARPHRSGETRQPGIGLDRDAVPALEIERKRRVVVDGVPGSDVDVEPVAAASEAAHEVQILEALRVGDGRRGHDSYPRWGGGSRWLSTASGTRERYLSNS